MFARVGNFQLFRYLSEVKSEIQKVSWPSREQTIQQTILVIIASLVVSIFIGALDFGFEQLIKILVK